jgi:hypothetical protein
VVSARRSGTKKRRQIPQRLPITGTGNRPDGLFDDTLHLERFKDLHGFPPTSLLQQVTSERVEPKAIDSR